MRILIVEDEGIVAKDIRRFVEQLGYSMAGYASTGEEALSAMRQSQPDLILLDIGLRGSIDGVETARRIHESFDTPIIFLTAYSDHATLQRAKETNPFGYLLKPFEERELYSAVEMARHRYSLEKALRVSEARFRDLFDEAPIGYHELDKEGNITRINRTELEMAGYTQEEMVGHCIADFLMEAEDARASLKEKLSGRKPVGQIFERTYRRKDGSTLPVSIVEKLVYDNRGKILGLRTTVVNISERKQAEYERNRQAAHLVDLTQAAARFAEMQYDDDVYAFIGSFLRDFIGSAYIVVNRYDSASSEFVVQFIAAPGDVIQRAVDLLGSEITGNRFPVDEEAFQNIAGGKLVVVQGGIYRMSFQRYPAALCKAVEKALGLADFYSIGFVRKNEILGSATIITVGKNARIDTQAVEAFARQASIALHKRASEDALRESEQKLRTFIAQSPEGMVLLDESGSIIEWNAEAERLSGVQRSQVLTRKMWEVEHLLLSDEEVAHGLAEDHHRQLLNALTSGMLTGPDRFMLHPIHRLTGEVRHIAVALSIIKTGRGHMIAITGRDLTGQMDAEARSRKSEEEFRLVWEQSFDGMRLIDYEGTIVMVNQAFCRLVGMDRDALIGKPFSQVYEKRHQRTMLEHEKELIKTRALEANFERRYVLWDGRAVWLQLSNSFIERAPGTVLLLSIFRDVTKRHHSEEILRFQSEILNRIGDAVIVTDDSYHVIYMNAAAEKMYTTTTESSIGRLIGELYHWHESAHAGQTEIFSEAATKGLSHAESIQVLPDGLEFLAELTISRSNAISNQKQAFIVVIRDVTEHRRSEEAVRNSEQKYRSVVECSNDGIVLVDEGGVILEWNHGQELISGLERQDAVGKLIWDVQYRLAPDEKKTPENYEHIKETGLRFVNAGNPGATGTVYENIIQRPDGERCVIQIVHSPVQTEKGFMIMSIARQVPIRQNLEFQNTSFTPPPIKG